MWPRLLLDDDDARIVQARGAANSPSFTLQGFFPRRASQFAMSRHQETATSHRAVLAETAGEPARPVCVLRSDVPGLGNIQLTRERSTVVIGRSRSVDYRIDHPQAPRSSRPSLTHRNSPRPPACWPSLRVVVHS